MTTHHDHITRAVDIWLGKTDKSYYRRGASSVFADDRGAYSWGTHFPLVVPLRDKRGAVHTLLLNGDTYSHSTTRHQSLTRSIVAQRDVRSLIVPFSAIDAADIDRDSIVPLHITEDTWTEREHTGSNLAHLAWRMRGGSQQVWGSVDAAGLPANPAAPGARWGYYTEQSPEQWYPQVEWRPATVHLRDGSTISYSAPSPSRPSDDMLAGAWYEWTTSEHRLGESLFRAVVRTGGNRRAAHFLSGFDHQETRPLYFLCELPTRASTSIPEAYEELKPPTVKAAEQAGREVKRQGDVFAVPTIYTTRDLTRMGAVRVKHGRLLGTSHVATDVATLGKATLARKTMRHEPVLMGLGRRASDHKRVQLGDVWHLIVKNTVPVTK